MEVELVVVMELWLRIVLMNVGVLTSQDDAARPWKVAKQEPVAESQLDWTWEVVSWHSLQIPRVVKGGKVQVPLVQVKKGRISNAEDALLVSERRAAL